MAFTRAAPNAIESDLGYRVELVPPHMRYVEGDRSALIEAERLGTGGNAFLGIAGDGILRFGLYPWTIRMESLGAPFTADEQLRLVRRIMAAYAWDGIRVQVVPRNGEDATSYYASEH